MESIKRFIRDEEGQNMIEYGLVAALVAVGAIAALTALKTQIADLYTYITGKIADAMK